MAAWGEVSPGERWPLVGREAELAVLATALLRRRHIVVIGGAGVGKTRLVAEAAAASARPAVHVIATAAAASVPFGAFAPLLPDSVPAVRAVSSIRVIFEAAGPETFLVVDDAHLLDAASASAVHQLAFGGMTVLATLRAGAQTSDAITALWKCDEGDLVELRPLSAQAISLLLERVLGGQVDTGAVHELAMRSAGNPLFLRELVRAALEAEVLVRRRDLWVLVKEPAFADRLADLLPVRVGSLAPQTRRLAELVALAEPVPLDILLPLVDSHAMEEAEEQGLVAVTTEATGHAVRLAHPLYGDAVRAALTATRRLRLFGELADALGPATAEVPRMRRAVFELEAGRRLEPTCLLELSRLARPLDPALAQRFARAATDAGGGVAAALELADLLAHAQRHEEVDTLLGRFDAAALPPMERVAVTATRALSLSFAGHRPETALAVLDAAEDLGPVPALQAARAVALMRAGRMTQAVALAEPLARDVTLPPAIRMHASFSALGALALSGRPGRGRELVSMAETLLPAALPDLPQAAETLRLLEGLVRFVAGDLAGEQATAEAGHAQCLATGAVGERLQFAQVLGRLAIMRGRPRAAIRLLRETHAGEGLWWEATLPWTITLLTEALSAAGELRQAREVLSEVDPNRCAEVYAPYIALAEAEIEAAGGAASAAVEHARRAGEIAEANGQRWIALLAFHASIRYGDTTAAPRVIALASQVDGAFAPAISGFAGSRAAADAAGLERAATMFGQIGAHLFEAEAQACAVRAYRAMGRAGLAGIAAERLRSILANVEQLTTLALVGVGRLEALTSREAEVARLAANGFTDREIAENLRISVRTAQTHLTRVYAKLGVTGRRQLAEELRGIDPRT